MQKTAVRKEFERSDITLLPRSTGGAARAQTPCNCSAARPVSCHICNSFEALVMQLGAPRRSDRGSVTSRKSCSVDAIDACAAACRMSHTFSGGFICQVYASQGETRLRWRYVRVTRGRFVASIDLYSSSSSYAHAR